MSGPQYLERTGEDQPLAIKRRPGLQAERVLYRSEPWWVVKDPHDQQYHRYNEHEYAILSWLDGSVSFADLRERFERTFAPYRVSYRELTTLLREFFKQSVVVSTHGENGAHLHDYAREKRRKRIQQKAKSLLGIRLRGWDPSAFLDATHPLVNWFFSRQVVFFNLLLTAIALGWLGTHYDQFVQRLPSLWSLLNGSNLVPLALTISATKFLHELGHAYVHKRYGGECHEIGVMIFFFVPTLYCNTSDSWMFRDKWQRMAVGAAGVYVESLLFALATFAWWFAPPGLVQDVALNLMVICSISAALTNGNPLMRYDGYFVLADWLGMPNLAKRAGKEVRRVFLNQGLGIEREVDPWNSDFNKRVLFAYGVASFAYKVLLISAISYVVVDRFRFAGMVNLGLVIAALSLVTLAVAPIGSLWTYFKQPGARRRVRPGRLLITSAVTAGLIAAGTLVPLPYYATAECAVELVDQQTVYAPQSARIEAVYARAGEAVVAGQPLLLLRDDDLEQRLLEVESELAEAELRLSLRRTPKRQEDLLEAGQATASLGALAASRAKLRAELGVLTAQQEGLLVRAPRDGFVFALNIGQRLADTDDQNLNLVSGDPLSRRNLGAWLERGDELCRIGDNSQREITLLISQADNSLVRRGQPVTLMLASLTRRLRGEVRAVSLRENRQEDLPAPIFEQSESPLVARVKQAADADKRTDIDFKDGQTLTSATLQATVRLHDDPGEALTYASIGKARVHVGDHTLAWRAQRLVAELLQRVQ